MNFEDLRLFVTVVDNGSFSKTAEQIDLPTSTLSRRLRKLEDDLGVRLLERTTRSLNLTELGEEFYQRSLDILENVDTTRRLLRQKQEKPCGRLRVYAPTEFSRVHFCNLIPEFGEQYPELTVELFTCVGEEDLVDNRVDVMIHIEEPEDSSCIGKKIATTTTNYYASREYLAKYGEPETPEDLAQHQCIVEAFSPHRYNRWLFTEAGEIREIRPQGRYVTDSTFFGMDLVERGLGISLLPDYICRQGVGEGRLKKLFGGRYESAHNLYALYPSRRYIPSKVRVFLAFLEAHFPETI